MNNMVHCNDGTTVIVAGNLISAGKETYMYLFGMLTGRQGNLSMNVKNIDEAVGTICGFHGGRKF